jgi:uncharacterized membrane protein YagU involved in acid resistance
MRKEISHIAVGKTSFFFGLMAFVLSFIFSIPMAIMAFMQGDHEGGVLLLTLPFIYFVFAYIGWVVWSWVYNLVARSIGGVVLDLKDKE